MRMRGILEEEKGAAVNRMTETFSALFCGLLWFFLWLLFFSLLLAALHSFTSPFILAACGLALVLSISFGLRPSTCRRLSPAWTAAVLGFLLGGLFAVYFTPFRGQWLAGGWDPGIYSNLGIRTARTGTFNGAQEESALALLNDDDRQPFVRSWGKYIEAFPGCPVDSDGHIQGSFFRTFPTWIGLLHHFGGYRTSTRANDVAGLLSLAALFFMLINPSLKLSLPIFACILTALNPIWLYHLHTPLPELMQIVFLLSFIAFYMHKDSKVASTSGAALCLFLAVTNRGSFFAFGSAAILISAWQDRIQPCRIGTLTQRALFVLALSAGLFFNQLESGDYLLRLQHIQPFILKAGFTLLSAALLYETACLVPSFKKWTAGIREILIYRIFILLITAVLIAFLFIRPEALANAKAILSFTGYPLMLLTAGGLITLCRSTNHEQRSLGPWVLYFFAATTLMIIEKHAAHLFPWATRRFVVYTVPLAAIAGGIFLHHIWQQKKPIRYLSLILIMSAACSGLQQRYRAWRYTEYNGLQQTVHAIAEQIPTNTVVLADHFIWGTPLNFLYGIPVLNGAGLLSNQADCQQALHAIRAIEKSGRNVQLLTSTDKRASIFVCDMGFTNLLWASAPYEYETIVHSPRADEFLLKKQTVSFHLLSKNHDP